VVIQGHRNSHQCAIVTSNKNTLTAEPFVTSTQQEYNYSKRDATVLIASMLVVSIPRVQCVKSYRLPFQDIAMHRSETCVCFAVFTHHKGVPLSPIVLNLMPKKLTLG